MIAWMLAACVLQAEAAAPPSEKDELKEAWTKALDLCRAQKKDELAALVAGMEFAREELVALFGEEKAAKMHPRYQEAWKKVRAEAAADLIDRCAKGSWEAVEVWAVDELDAKERTADDRGVLEALVAKDAKVYNVRLKAKDKTSGFVLRCFVKTKGGWRVGLKIGSALAEK